MKPCTQLLPYYHPNGTQERVSGRVWGRVPGRVWGRVAVRVWGRVWDGVWERAWEGVGERVGRRVWDIRDSLKKLFQGEV